MFKSYSTLPVIFFVKTLPRNFSLLFSLETKVGILSSRLSACADFRLKVLASTVAREEHRVAFLPSLKGLSHEIDFKNFDKHLQNLA